MSGWDDVGGNPAPGDVGALSALAAREGKLAQMLTDICTKVSGIRRDVGAFEWTGSGATAVEDKVSRTEPTLEGVRIMHLNANGALTTFASRLADLQAQASTLLNRYEQETAEMNAQGGAAAQAAGSVRGLHVTVDELAVRIRVARLNPHESAAQLLSLERQHDRAVSELNAAAARQAVAQRAHDDAANQVRSIRSSIDSIRREHDQYASAAISAIYNAAGLQAPSRNPLARIADRSVELVDSADFKIFLASCNVVAQEVSEVSAVLSTIPGLNALLAPVIVTMDVSVLALSAINLAGTWSRAATGAESWKDVRSSGVGLGENAVGVVPMAKILGHFSSKEHAAKVIEERGVPGMVKRVIYYSDARKARGFLRSEVKVAPKLDKISASKARALYSIGIVKETSDTVDKVKSDIDAVRDAERRWDAKANRHVPPPPPMTPVHGDE
jgi:hypothetical protein